jgi:hypothetical protein
MPGHQKLRKRMLAHKDFLASLYRKKSGKANVSIIERSSRKERNVLLNILFCIAHGHIPLRGQSMTKLIQSNRKPKVVEIGVSLKKLLKASDQEQQKCLKQFSSLYHELLSYLFEK